MREPLISSVVPSVTPTFVDLARRYYGVEALVVGPATDIGIRVEYENPQEVGADRLVNAVAAYARYGGPLVVVGAAGAYEARCRRCHEPEGAPQASEPWLFPPPGGGAGGSP